MSLDAMPHAPGGAARRLHVQVLGPVEAERDGSARPLGSPLQRRLLAALAAAGGRTVSSGRLVDALWGEDPPVSARNSLQSHVARLRASLGDRDAVVTRPPGYALDLDRVEIDAVAFETLVGRARRNLQADPAAAVEQLAGALARWRGAAYGEFADDVARPEAVRLEGLRAEARRLLADARVLAGDVHGAISELRQLVAEDPHDEEAVVALARGLGHTGRVREALEHVRALRDRLAGELGLDPGPALAEVEQELLRGEIALEDATAVAPVRPPAVMPTRVPRLASPTLGRVDEQRAIAAALGTAPLVTLVGTGGVGKTHLAVTAAADAPGGAVGWVELAPVRAGADVLPAVLDALGDALPPATSGRTAAVASIARWRGLLVLDNCEHLLDEVAALVDAVLAHGGPVRLLATSRERLDVPGERALQIAPLHVPDPGTATDADPAVQLFLDRVAAAGGHRPEVADAAAVVAAVDGLPLAIELAAARAATLPVDVLLDRLGARLDVLAGTVRRHGRRQRTLTDVVTWSHDLLGAPEQVLFRRLSVFPSGFTLDAARAVCSGEGLDEQATVDVLARLVEQSMVTRVDAGRYRLLEPLRLYAAERLAGAGEAEDTAARHRDLALSVAARADADMTGPGEEAAVADVEAALPDLRAAHARAVGQGDLATVALLAGRLYRFAYAQARCDVLAWGEPLATARHEGIADGERLRAVAAAVAGAWMSGRLDVAQALAAVCRDRLDDGSLDAWDAVTVTEALGDLAVNVGDLSEGARIFEYHVAAAGTIGHPGLESLACSSLAITRLFRGEFGEADRLVARALELADRSQAPSTRALARYTRGELLAEQDPEQGLRAFADAVADAARIRGRFLEGIARTAEVALRGRHGDPVEALEHYRSALGVWQDAGADGLLLTTLRNLVVLLARVGADDGAVTLYAAVHRLAPRAPYGAEVQRLQGAAAAATERLDATARSAAQRAATELVSLADATRFGLRAIDAALAR